MQHIQFHPAATANRITHNLLQFLQMMGCRLIQRLARNQRSDHSAQHWY